jgi:hypothetical protein
MPDSNLDLEKQFHALLNSQPLLGKEEGYFKTTALNFSQFCQALNLYCEMSQQKGARSKKTSFLHRKTALKLKNTVATLRGTQEQQEEALYQILIVLQQNKQVKAYGLDKVDSDLYLIFTRYRNFYYEKLIEKMTPWVLRESLMQDFLKVQLTTEEQNLVKMLKTTLHPYVTAIFENTNDRNKRTSIPSIEEFHYVRLNKQKAEKTLDNEDAKKLAQAQDKAFRKANDQIVAALYDGKIRNPHLASILTRYTLRAKNQLAHYSYTQAEQNDYLNSLTQALTHETLILKATHHRELTDEKQARLKAENERDDIAVTQSGDKTYFDAEIKRLAIDANRTSQQMKELLKTNDVLAQELKEKAAQLNDIEKKLVTGSHSQQTSYSRIEALGQAKEKVAEDFVKAKQTIVLLTQEMEKNQKQNEELNRRMQIARTELIEHHTEIEQLNVENKTLKNSLVTLMGILRPLLAFFGLKRAGEYAPLKKKLGATQAEQLDYILLADVLKTECESHFKKDDSFPTKPPLATALPIFQQIIEGDKCVREKLLKTHAQHVRHLVMKLLGKLADSSTGKDEVIGIWDALCAFKDKFGQETIIAMNLPKYVIKNAYASMEKNICQHLKNQSTSRATLDELETLLDKFYHAYIEREEGERKALGTARTSVGTPKVSNYSNLFFDSSKDRPLPPIPKTPTKVEEAIDSMRSGNTP